MNKCILLSRVSTHSQDLKQQTDELYIAAHRKGYNDENIIVIEDKESAIKLSEEERNGLNELKKQIENDASINCVIVYETSRIARKEKILYSIRDYLIERHIQLIVLNPYIELLDANGEMTQSAQVIFAMFCALSQSEMHIKQQRLIRGKKAKAAQGYYIGGALLFGYNVDSHNKLIVDEEKAKIVRKMFNMYLNGGTISSIATELCATGELNKLHWKQAYSQVYKILVRHEYYGGNGLTENHKYPPIITKQLFDDVQKLLRQKSRPHSKTKYIYYAQKLLRCRKDNHCFVPTISSCCYRYGGDVYIKDEHRHLRVVSWNINMNLVDSILWHFAQQFRNLHKPNDIIKYKRKIEDEITKLKRKLNKAISDIKEYESKTLKVNERIIYGKMSEIQGDDLIRKFKREIDDLQQNIAYYETKIGNLTCEYHLVDLDLFENSIESIVDDKERYDIIHQCIKVVWVDKMKFGRYKFELIFVDDTKICFETIPNNDKRILLESGKYEHFKRLDRFNRKWTKRCA